jgi:mono/diheme cytochrome c family protein
VSDEQPRNPLWLYLLVGGACALTVLLSIYVATQRPSLKRGGDAERSGNADTPGTDGPTDAASGAHAHGVTAEITAGGTSVTRTLPALGFRLTGAESLDERIPPGAFTARFIVHFDPGAVRQAIFGADLQGGQLTVKRLTIDGADIILTDAAGDTPRRAMSSAITPVRLARGTETLVYEFVRTDPSVPAVLRALWRPMDSSVALPLPSDGADPVGDAVVRGRVLFQTLRCASCHPSRNEAVHARLDVAPGPNLDEVGSRVRPDWLRSWLREPAAVKGGTTMPRVAPADARDEQWVEDLTHFLVARGGPL